MQIWSVIIVIGVIFGVIYALGSYNSESEYKLRQAKIEQRQEYEQHRHDEAMKPNNSKVDKLLRWMIK